MVAEGSGVRAQTCSILESPIRVRLTLAPCLSIPTQPGMAFHHPPSLSRVLGQGPQFHLPGLSKQCCSNSSCLPPAKFFCKTLVLGFNQLPFSPLRSPYPLAYQGTASQGISPAHRWKGDTSCSCASRSDPSVQSIHRSGRHKIGPATVGSACLTSPVTEKVLLAFSLHRKRIKVSEASAANTPPSGENLEVTSFYHIVMSLPQVSGHTYASG